MQADLALCYISFVVNGRIRINNNVTRCYKGENAGKLSHTNFAVLATFMI